jgi:hypothetical protein
MTGPLGGRLTLGLVALVGVSAAAVTGSPEPAAANPGCTYAQPFRSVAKAFRRVVKAKRTVRTISRTDERWTGQIILTEPDYIKWPKGEAKPGILTVDFDYNAEESCPYYPDPFHRYFVLEKADGRFSIVNSTARRR